MKKFCEDCKDRTKHENDECLECESLSKTESESDGEDEYRIMYCKNCKLETSVKCIPEYHNFICQSCKKFSLGLDGLKIIESPGYNGLELYVTRDMFIYLAQYDLFKSLMEIYEERIYISTNNEKQNFLTNNSRIHFGNPFRNPFTFTHMREFLFPQKGEFPFPHMMNSKSI